MKQYGPVRTLSRRLLVIQWLAVLALAPLVCYHTTSGTWDLARENSTPTYTSGFFLAQAQAMLAGHLDVHPEAIHAECFIHDEKCYGYFGLTPSVLRLAGLPYLNAVQSSMTPAYIAIAVLLGYWAALNLLRRSLVYMAAAGTSPGVATGYFLAGALVLGPGGAILFMTRPGVYEEAAAWGIAFTCLTLDRVWAWHQTGRLRSLLFAVVFGVAATNARPTAAPVCVSLGVVVAAIALARHREPASHGEARASSGTGKPAPMLIAAAALTLLPALTMVGVFYLKFDAPLPDMMSNEQIGREAFWKQILETNGGHTSGLIFMPTELVAYFRPDTLIGHRQWPWIRFRFPERKSIAWIAPLPRDGVYVERTASTTATMPLAWILNSMAIVWLAVAAWPIWRGRRQGLTRADWLLFAGSFACAATMPLAPLTTVGITNRYLGDFYAISVIGFAVSHRLLLPSLSRHRFDRIVASLVALLLVTWGVLATISLTQMMVFP